jgi:hypothetical protein
MMTWTGSAFVYDWDTTVLTDGNYRLLVRVRDMVYNAGTDFINVYVDNTGPSAMFITPTNGQYVHSAQNLEVRATASDLSGVTALQVQLDGGGWTALTYDPTQGVWIGNVGVPGAGTHTLEARGVDGEGNVGTPVTIMVIGDANDPTAAIANPINGAELSGVLTIGVSATDAERLAGVIVQLTYGTTTFNLPASYNFVTDLWEVTIDTDTMPDGSYSIVAVAYDQAGRWATDGPNVVLFDNEAPAIAITDPVSGQYLYGDYTVRAIVDDGSGSGVDNGWVAYSVDGGPMVLMTLSGTRWTGALDTTLLSDGGHTLMVVAADDAGNIAVRTVSFVVDNTRPVVMVVAPATSEYAEGAYTFAVSAIDNLGLANVSVTITGSSSTKDVALGYNAASGYYEWTTDTTTWNDGAYTIMPYATELSGRAYMGASAVSFFVDNNAPWMTINAPLDGEVILSDTYDITVTASDGPFAIPNVIYRVDEGIWTAMTSGPANIWANTWDTSAVADGEHTLTFAAVDAAGHVSIQTITVIVDNTDPACMMSAPSAGQYLEGTVTFTVMASDGLGVAAVDLNFDGDGGQMNAAATYNPSSGYWEMVMDTTTMADGDYTVTAVATDTSGRMKEAASVDFSIDNNAPVVNVAEPMDGAVVTDGMFVIDVTATDEGFILDSDAVEYSMDGGPWMAITNTTPDNWTMDMDVTGLTDGDHTVVVRATDAAGHVTEVPLRIIVDNNDPVCQIVTPTSSEFVEGVYVFRVHSADALGVASVDLAFTGLPGMDSTITTWNPSTGYWEYPIDTTALDDSEATVTATAYDSSGRMTASTEVTFTVDNNAPTLRFATPVDGQVITEGSSIVTLIGDDMGFGLVEGQVQLRVDGGPWQDVDEGLDDSFEWDWNTSSEADGAHVLSARAMDAAGHSFEISVGVVVDNNDPSAKIVVPTDGQHLGGVVVFQVSAVDFQDIDTVTLSWDEGDGVPATLSSVTNYYEYTLDTSSLADGTYTLSVEVVDGSGRETLLVAEFNVDNTVPALNMLEPLPDDILVGDGTINVDVSDIFLSSVQYRVDDLGWVDIEGDSAVLDTTTLSDGDHTITVRAVDEYGREVTTSALVVVDNADPELSFADIPGENVHVAGDVPIALHADDAVGVTQVTVTIDQGAPLPMFLNPETGFFEWTFQTDSVDGLGGGVYSDGLHILTFIAHDAAGHETELVRRVVVDNTGPVLVTFQPKSGAVKGNVLFKVTTADESGVENVYVRLGNDDWQTMNQQTDGSWVWVWQTEVADNIEDLTVRFQAIDNLGNSQTERVTIDVDNFNWWPVIALMIIVVFVAFLVLLWKKGYLFTGSEEEEGKAEVDELEVDVDDLLEDNMTTTLSEDANGSVSDLGIDQVG